MILVDSNVLIDFFNNPSEKIRDQILQNEIAVCGIVEAELLHGAKPKSQIEAIELMLSDFEFLSICDDDWKEIGKEMYTLRTKGLSVPFQDAVIAYVARKYSAQVWTHDKHFKLISAVFSDLKLYAEK